MKTFLTLFILLFSSSVMADDISDFEIEGMSIGDSLLDYFSETEIKSFRSYSYDDNQFYSIDIINSSLIFKIYHGVQVQIKTNDRKYILHGISGALFYEDNEFNICMKKLKEIKSDIKNIFTAYSEEEYDHSHPNDINSNAYSYFLTNKEGEISLQCIEWSKKYANEKNLYHNLRVSVFTNDFSYWISNIAYQ